MKYIFIKKSFTQLKHVLLLLIVLAISTQYISASVNTAQQTPKEVTGKVFDSTTKETLPGVSIVVKGTNTGVMSDIDGNFKIKVPYQDATLIFSYMAL